MPTHYKPRKISQIMNTDSKIAVIGKVVQVDQNSFVLNDDTGKAEIFSEEAVEQNKVVRAFCTIAEGKLKAEIVQKLENFDLNLFKKIEELYNRAGL